LPPLLIRSRDASPKRIEKVVLFYSQVHTVPLRPNWHKKSPARARRARRRLGLKAARRLTLSCFISYRVHVLKPGVHFIQSRSGSTLRKRLFNAGPPRVSMPEDAILATWFDRLFAVMRGREFGQDLRLNQLVGEFLVTVDRALANSNA
jgi:hypothetical protein